MDKIKRNIKKFKVKMHIRAAFVLYVSVAMILSIGLIMLAFSLVDWHGENVAFYIIQPEDDAGKVLSEESRSIKFFVDYDLVEDDYFDGFIVFYAKSIVVVLAIVIFIISFAMLSSAFFYSFKIKEPLRLLKDGAEKISQKSLDFTVQYNSQDEMGELCKSFEVMRYSLEQNNKKMWSMIEEQRQIHDAFSHDIRTPLTVLRGYNDLLIERIPENQISEEMLMKTLHLMKDNLIRLENFTVSMSNLQKLSDLSPEYFETDLELAYEMLKENALMIQGDIKINFRHEEEIFSAILPVDFIKQIITNLLTNAQRFAKKEIDIFLKINCDSLTIKVQDDGDGFSKEALAQAKNAYYSESNEHFGLGLHICSILSKKIDGSIEIANNNIGAIVTFTCPITTKEDTTNNFRIYYK